nr:hypothetical protein [Tanacetum cinerariifolium]
MIELHETLQAWLQQRKDQVFNLDSYSPKPLQCRKIPIYYDDDNDDESSTPLRDIIISKLPLCIAITHVLSTEEPKDSIIMGDEHLDTILEKESDEFIKSSVENLVPNPSESEDLSNIGSECDVPVCDDFTTFFNLLFDADDNFSSSDDMSFFDEDSFHFDVPSFPRPPAKPPDDDEIDPDMGILTIKVVGDISEHYVLMPRFYPPNLPLLQMRRNLFISYLIGALKLSRFLLKAR